MSFVLGISGSLRKAAATTGLLRAVSTQLPKEVRFEIADLNLPLFNRDLEVTGKVPDSVRTLREQLQVADAILFSVPEHTFGIAAPIQNAIDWSAGIRAATGERNLFKGKVCGVVGVGTGSTPKYYTHILDFAKDANMKVVERTLYFSRTSASLNAFNLKNGDVVNEQVTVQLKALVDEILRLARK